MSRPCAGFLDFHLSATCPIGNLCRSVISHTENIRHRHVPHRLLACATRAAKRVSGQAKPLRFVTRRCSLPRLRASRHSAFSLLYIHYTRSCTRCAPGQGTRTASLSQLSLFLSSLYTRAVRDRDLSRPVNAFRESITGLPIL